MFDIAALWPHDPVSAYVAVVGAIVLFAWLWLTIWSDIEPFCCVNVWDTILDTIIQLVAVLIGVLIAAGIFLVTVLKS